MTSGFLGRIAVAIDGSRCASQALDFAIDLAKKYSSELTILAVAPLLPAYVPTSDSWVPAGLPKGEVEYYRGIVETAVQRAQREGVSATTGVCLEGVVAEEILSHLDRHATNLLVLGSRGLSTTKRLLLGSVSDAVAHHVRCPVLIVKPSG
ncbi:MAG: universal stress protein [Thermoplasmata archaeon]